MIQFLQVHTKHGIITVVYATKFDSCASIQILDATFMVLSLIFMAVNFVALTLSKTTNSDSSKLGEFVGTISKLMKRAESFLN